MHFNCKLICNLYSVSIKVKSEFQAYPRRRWRGARSKQPSLGRPCPVSSAMPPPAPLHYVAFASYCLCIASARLAPVLFPVFFSCPFFFIHLLLLSRHPSLQCQVGANQRGLGSELLCRRGRTWLSRSAAAAAAAAAVVVFEVKVVVDIGREYAMSPGKIMLR